jgi:xanthine dehydrogenase accessory factor
MLNRRLPKHQALATSQQLLRFVHHARADGLEAVLVFLTSQTNGGPRSPGALMAVLETGDRAGSFSSGCVEAALPAVARRMSRTGG